MKKKRKEKKKKRKEKGEGEKGRTVEGTQDGALIGQQIGRERQYRPLLPSPLGASSVRSVVGRLASR